MGAVPEQFERDFEGAYRAHYAVLSRRSRRYLPPEEAEEAVQETFLRAWARFQGRDPGMPWLFTVLQNLIIDRSRKKGALPVPDIQVLDTSIPDEPAESVVSIEERRTVREALSDLTVEQQEAMRLREWEGLSYAEIAEKMGASVASVESLLQRGRRRLRSLLDGAFGWVMWPVAGLWRRVRGTPESATATHAAPVVPGLVQAVAGLAAAAVVVAVGVAGGGGSSGQGTGSLPPAGGSGKAPSALAIAAAEREDARFSSGEQVDRVSLPGGAEVASGPGARDEYEQEGGDRVEVPIQPDEKGDGECDCVGVSSDALTWVGEEVTGALGS